MLRIVRNTYTVSYSDKIKTDKTDYSEVENSFEELSSKIDTEHFKNEIISNLSVDEISKIISTLPDDFKMVIVLCDIIKFNYEEISDFVDIPDGVVRSRLHRGRKMLFVKLYNYASSKGLKVKTGTL